MFYKVVSGRIIGQWEEHVTLSPCLSKKGHKPTFLSAQIRHINTSSGFLSQFDQDVDFDRFLCLF